MPGATDRPLSSAAEPTADPSSDSDLLNDIAELFGESPAGDASPNSRSRKRAATPDEEPTDDDPSPDAEDDEDDLTDDEPAEDDEAEPDDDEDAEDDLDEDELEAIRRERDTYAEQLERQQAQAERERREAEAHATEQRWQQRKHEGMAHFDRIDADLDEREERLAASFSRSTTPEQYVLNGIRQIRNERKQNAAKRLQWNDEFTQNYNAKQGEQMLDITIRAMVAEARLEHGLTFDEGAQLAEFARKYPDPDLVGREFDRLMAARDTTKKSARAAARKARQRVAREFADATPRPGQGKRSARPPRERGEDDRLSAANTPW